MAVRKSKPKKPAKIVIKQRTADNSSSVRLYNLAKTKQQQRMRSSDPGTRKGSTKSPMQLMDQIGRETKKREKMLRTPEYKFITKKGKRIAVRSN